MAGRKRSPLIALVRFSLFDHRWPNRWEPFVFFVSGSPEWQRFWKRQPVCSPSCGRLMRVFLAPLADRASPSAVSKSVARLEQRLGVRLFARSTHTLSPTPKAPRTMSTWPPICAPSRKPKTWSGSWNAWRASGRHANDVGRPLISAWARSFLDRYPDIELDLSVTDRHVNPSRRLRHGSANRGTGRSRSGWPLVGRAVHVLGASPKYLPRRGIPGRSMISTARLSSPPARRPAATIHFCRRRADLTRWSFRYGNADVFDRGGHRGGGVFHRHGRLRALGVCAKFVLRGRCSPVACSTMTMPVLTSRY